MQVIQLYIEGQRVDMFKDESVTITQSIQNVKDIAKVFTDFSKTFSVPASKTNNKIFKHYYNYDIQNGFDARKKKDATIELNNVTFREGKIKLEGVDLKNNVPHTYRITFFGNTVSLKDVLGEDKLQSLSDLDTESLVYDADTIRNKLQSDPATNDIIVPLITHSQQLFYDSTQSDNDLGNLFYENGQDHGVLYFELKYALRVHRIIQAIENNYEGIKFSNDFFTDTNAPYYDLFMWLHRKKGNVQNLSGVNQSLVNGWSSTSLDPDTETRMVNTSTLRVEGLPQYYDVLNLIIQNPVGGLYKVIVQKNGNEIYKSNETSSGIIFSLRDDDDFGEADYTVFIESENNITFSDIYWDIVYTTPTFFGGITYNTGTYNYQSKFDFIITQQIPEMKIIDFLTGLFKMFNLTAYVKNDIIVVERLDAFYENGNTYDISKYLDVEKSSVNVALPYREISFSYEDTGTILAKQHTQLAGKDWAKTEYKGQDGKLDGGLYSIKLPFGHLKNEKLINLQNGQETGIMYGYYVDDNEESYIGKPLLFYPIRQEEETISFLNSLNDHVPVYAYNVPSNSVSLDSEVSKANINFFLELNEYTNSSDFTDTLFNVYYSKYITDVFKKENRITKVSAYLPLRILSNYTLADRFVINGRSYKINSITSNLETGKSELELLNDL